MGSTFIAGLLASGVESQLALSIAKTAEIMKNQIELQKQMQDSYRDAAIASGNAVQGADDAAAEVERSNMVVSEVEGGVGLTGPALSIGYSTYREGAMPLKQPSELKEMNEDSSTIKSCKDILHEGKGEVVSGPLEDNSEELESLKHKSVLPDRKTKTAGFTDSDKEKLGLAKKVRSNGPKNESSRTGRLYDELDEKLNKEEDRIHTRRSNFDRDTDRRLGYLNTVGNSLTNFMKGVAQVYVAKAREDQGDADQCRSLADYAVNNQKSGVDTTQQAYQNTAQLYSEEIRTFSDIARANAAV